MSQRVQQKTEYQSSVCLPYIGPASHKIERILKEVGVQVYHSSQNKLFRFLCTHKDSIVRESIEKEKHNTIDQEGKPLDSMWRALFNVQN